MLVSQQQTVILVGAGHAHLHVAAHAEALVKCGARVVLVDPTEFWYSGLATGMLGGMYEPEADQIDPRPLIEARGGEFIQDRVESVDSCARQLHLDGGGVLAFDYVSINVGSRVDESAILGADNDPSVWSVKPVANLWKLREYLEARFCERKILRVAVVGGGPTGSEVTANLTALAGCYDIDLRVTLITNNDRLIPEAPAGAARALQRKLTKRGVVIRTHTHIVRREGESLIAEDGRVFEADVVVLALGLEAHPLVYKTGLPTHPKNGLRINAMLHSIDDERVFAAGDCAAMEGFNLPKLGVFGVRQAAYIHANLLASLDSKPLATYEPQKRYLAILNLGDGTALSTWGPFWWNGSSSMWLKHWIDHRFLKQYR
ncbi:MAG: pyridine nucleotide-disulfide oxidoreductase [Nitrospirales bacterium]|nr:MAG: pyridine nucleotide-disulfide oxidoreductase [Nitrospirales bacterium]